MTTPSSTSSTPSPTSATLANDVNINLVSKPVKETDFRTLGREALNTVLKNESNIRIIEKLVYVASTSDLLEEGEIEAEVYKNLVYQVIGDILTGCKLKEIQEYLKAKRSLWDHPVYNVVKNRIAEQDDFVVNPFEIEEGVLECKCGSKRVYSYSKQDRAGDEATSVYAQCLACNKKWKNS